MNKGWRDFTYTSKGLLQTNTNKSDLILTHASNFSCRKLKSNLHILQGRNLKTMSHIIANNSSSSKQHQRGYMLFFIGPNQ